MKSHGTWFLILVSVCIFAPYMFHLAPKAPRQRFYVAVAIAFLAWLLALMAPLRSAQDLRSVGSFHNIRQSSGEESHCYGWSLELWQFEGRVVGLLDHHEGLCGDPPCQAVKDASLDPKTGRLSFSAFGMPFSGTLRRNEVRGALGRERLRLKRTDDPMDAASDKTIDAWCGFWRTVPRCTGVAEVCASLGVPR